MHNIFCLFSKEYKIKSIKIIKKRNQIGSQRIIFYQDKKDKVQQIVILLISLESFTYRPLNF